MTLYLSVILTIALAGVVVSILVSRSSQIVMPANRLLALAFFTLSLIFCQYLLTETAILSIQPGERVREFLLMLFASLSYLYLRGIIDNRSMSRIDVIHFIPSAFFLVDFLWRNFQPFSQSPIPDQRALQFAGSAAFYTGLKLIGMGIYWVAQVRLIWRFYSHDVRSRKIQSKAWREWIIVFVALECMIWLPDLPGILLEAMQTTQLMADLAIMTIIAYTLIILIRRPEILFGLAQTASDRSSLSEQALLTTLKGHESSSGDNWTLNIGNGPEVLETLSALMEEDKPFLLKNYRIEDLAKELKLSVSQVDSLLTDIIGLSFSPYIDQQRIFHCHELMQVDADRNLSRAQLSSSCGFDDVTAFMKAFRRYTATDPETYYKHLRKENLSRRE